MIGEISMTQEIFARVILFKDGDSFIAQCLEYDILAHGLSEESTIKRFEALDLKRN